MTNDTNPVVELTDASLDALLKRALRDTAILGVAGSVVLLVAGSWRNTAMLASGAVISAASIFEWQRMIRLLNAKIDQKKTSRGGAVIAVFFVLRLTLYAGVIYVSLKCFQGSAIALLCGLGMALLALVWEAFGLLRS